MPNDIDPILFYFKVHSIKNDARKFDPDGRRGGAAGTGPGDTYRGTPNWGGDHGAPSHVSRHIVPRSDWQGMNCNLLDIPIRIPLKHFISSSTPDEPRS
ncbi:hypothetical protein O181_012127 [Austropuccinia psidii MF-1]|uniref:Uncharacterized protein n=1 Tax=Austropuccinia psidii MF-1 TaxID=1389203 RepID=A0A9Q3BX24_9BASI|nr:hypothetical protein [Austropuccinia psidii MF-1]